MKITNYYRGCYYHFQTNIDLEHLTFEICSKHIYSETYSFITNLNFLISQYEENLSDNDSIDDSTWIINSVVRLKFINRQAKALFTNKIFIKHLEKALDEDREIGDWNSDYRFDIA